MSALRELLATFGVEVEGEDKLERFEGVLEGTIHKIKNFGRLLTGGIIAEGLSEFVEHTVDAGTQLKAMSLRLGVSTDELQQWQFAAKMSSASAEDLTTGVRFLTRNIGLAADGHKEGAAVFQKLGIAIKGADGNVKSASDILPLLADKMKEAKSQAERTAIAVQLLGRGGMALVPMLSKGSEGLEEFKKEFEGLGGGITDQFVEQAEEAEHAMTRWGVVSQGLKTMLIGSFLPTVSELIGKITVFAAKFRQMVTGTYALKTAFTTIIGVPLIAYLMHMAKAVGILSLETLLLVGQWVLIAAALFAAYLIFDDLYTMFKGGNSVLGKIIDKMYGVGASKKFVAEATKVWEQFTGAAGQTLPIMADLAKCILVAFVDSIPYVIKFAEILYNVVGGSIAEIMDELEGVGKALGDLAGGNFKMAWEDLKAGEHQRQADDKRMANGVMAAWNQPAPEVHDANGSMDVPESDYRNDKWANGKGSVQVGAIHITNNVTGTNDPKKASEEVGKATRKALRGKEMRDAFGAVGGVQDFTP